VRYDQLAQQSQRLDHELDDLLWSIWLVHGNRSALDGLFARLTEVCLEQVFLDLRQQWADGRLTRHEYDDAAFELAGECLAVGFLPLSLLEGR
jgi:hypothetical protein